MKSAETEIASVRGELEILRKALKLQTRRCRYLVAEYTRKLQERERQYHSEKMLREDQLAKVLRALLIFEARLKQEQKFITYQLSEKDYIIKKQNSEIKRLMSESFCKNCSQLCYIPNTNFESLDSSSEYVITDYQSSNFESLDSSSETCATISEKEYQQINADENCDSETAKALYMKNKNKDSLSRKTKRIQHRKSIGTYFEVLKMRNNNVSPFSNDDNTSNDYDNLESLPAESISDTLSTVMPAGSENGFDESTMATKNEGKDSDSSSYISVSEYNTVVTKSNSSATLQDETKKAEAQNFKSSKISDTIPVFDADNDANDNWYASASDPDDEEHRNVYRNNPVLECMNQILLQNINDNISSPPKTPNMERKAQKNKRVKFSDEEAKNMDKETVRSENNYYETPIQKVPNFYETPQSIYSNDYEQIMTKSNETSESKTSENDSQKSSNHLYIDMDIKPESEEKDAKITRKNKILRTPPALPPKPINLISKYKMKNNKITHNHLQQNNLDSEPDYCSISELNLPTKQFVKKISVVAEINTVSEPKKEADKEEIPQYDPVLGSSEPVPSLVASKSIEKLTIQLAKQTNINPKRNTIKSREPEIPKLPQVSEIIIPDETEPKHQQEERITSDNYVKNNSQILKLKTNRSDLLRHPIMVGSSVSALISGFNKQLLNEIGHKQKSLNKKPIVSPESVQQVESDFDKFDLSQNFEEFKLDDCEIEEEEEGKANGEEQQETPIETNKNPSTNVELVRATNDSLFVPQLNIDSVEQFKKKLMLRNAVCDNNKKLSNTPTYEHFLECTGLSSKSIVTPSRLLSNHKSMLKPKDVKLRSKATRSNGIEKQGNGGSTVKYWSEPFI